MLRTSQNIQFFRIVRNLKQSYVSEKLNLNPKTYAKIEKGTRSPTVDEMSVLAELFEISALHLKHFDPNLVIKLSEKAINLKRNHNYTDEQILELLNPSNN